MAVTQSHARNQGFSAALRRWMGAHPAHKTGKKMGRKDLFLDVALSPPVRSYMVMPGQPVWTDRNYYQFALEAYIRNVIAHRAMGMVSGAASSVALKLYATGVNGTRREITAHPLLDILGHPNPCQARGEFFQALHQYKLISGNAFIQAIGPRGEAPGELHLLRPDRMAVIAGKGTLPAGYRYTVNNQPTDFPVDRISGRSTILHLKNFHPLNDWYGLSAVEAAAYSIDQHNQSGAWNQALLQNGARPSGALVVKADSTGGGTLSEEQYNRVKLQIDDQFTGAANAGRPILLEGGLDWKEMSLTPKDMDFVEAKNSAARDIALAFGVPPQMLGIPGDNTYANLQEARLALWEQTVIPLVKVTTDALNGWLVPMFGDHLELCPDTDGISALALRNQAIWDRVQTASFLTTDEKRAAVGYGPLPKQDKYSDAQPRVPAGNSDGGQWTGGGGDDASDSSRDHDTTNVTSSDSGSVALPGSGMVMDDAGNITQLPEYTDATAPDSWADPDLANFEDHFEDHGADFNATSPDDYANQADQFYQKALDENLPAIEYPSGGRTAAYDPVSNTFGVYNPEGDTVTFYKPEDGADYFRDLVDTQVARGGTIINPIPLEEPIIPEIIIP